MAVEFIPAKKLLKTYSLWMHVVGTTVVSVFALVPTLPTEVQEAIPVKYRALALAIWAIGGIVGRAIKQHRDEAGGQ